MSFRDKVVIITGSATGIGKSTARAFLDHDAKVVLHGRQELVADTAAELDPKGERVDFVAGDIAKKETARCLVKKAVERFGGVDILINNAGYLHFKLIPFLEHTENDIDGFINIILKGTLFTTQAAVPEMQKRGGGAIVNVGSMMAGQAIGKTPSSAYSAAKAGVHALTKNLAIEFGPDHVRVNAVAPAVFEMDNQVGEPAPNFNEFYPLGRNGRPQDIIRAILFLAGNDAGWITGAVLPVDGGVTAGRQ